MGLIIKDGYTLIDTIDDIPGVPPLTYKYRPALWPAYTEYINDKKDEGAASAKALAAHVVEWDAKDDDGKPEPLNEETLAQLPGRVVGRMLDKIMGYAVPAANGQPSKEQADAKNSSTG